MTEEIPGDDRPVTFNIKTAGDAKYSVTAPLSMSVSGLKELLATERYAGLPADRQRLIYSGRVLKDGETLASYKIKEGMTVHMVKTAESNARNQPGTSSTPTTGSATNASQQLPNMAAGTGANNLLAGLTGARFAGLAQLPNQSMFGPDGGMGAPPDPEEAIRRLEDPEARRQLNEALSNPALLDEMIRQNPMLANMPGAREMLQNPAFREMMTNPETLRRSMQMHRDIGGGGLFGGNTGSGFQAPGGVESGEGGTQGGSGAAGRGAQAGQIPANPFAAMFGAPGGAGTGADNPFAALFNPAAFGGAQAPGGVGEAATNREGGATSPTANPFGGNPLANPFAQNMMRNLMNDPELMQRMMQSMWGSPPQQGTGNTAGQNREGNETDGNSTAGGSANTPSQGQIPPNPFAALLGAAGGMPGGAGGAGGAGFNPFAALGDLGAFGSPTSPPDNRPPEERYADQLRQLNDMGFFDFDRNVEALRRSGGSVQGAINHLLGG